MRPGEILRVAQDDTVMMIPPTKPTEGNASMPTFESLVNGFKIFKASTYAKKKDLITHLMEQGKRPTTLCITSCELRVSPEDLTSSNPGDLYVIRNPAGLIPPYRPVAQSSVAGILFAVQELKVQNILVLGHGKNEGIRQLLLMQGNNLSIDNTALDPLSRWLSVGIPARDAVREQLKHLPPHQQEIELEKELVLHSMNNLLGFPGIQELVDSDKLKIFGWHFTIESGVMLCFNPANQQFESLE